MDFKVPSSRLEYKKDESRKIRIETVLSTVYNVPLTEQ